MHELSIAISLIDLAVEQLERQEGGEGARVEAIYLKLGPLAGVVKEALLSAYALAIEGSPLAGSRLVIEEVPVEVDCPICGGSRPVQSIQEMRCRACGTFSAQVVRGRELDMVAMEICNEQPTPIG